MASRHEEMAKGQAERLMPMLEEVLGEAGATWQDLDAIGVGVGPGNFTGVRIAVSAARGLALGLEVPAVGVTAFEALRGHLARKQPKREVFALSSRNGWFLQMFEGGRPEGVPFELRRDDVDTNALDAFRGIPVFGDTPSVIPELSTESPGYNYAPFSDEDGLRISERVARVAAQKLAAGGAIPRPAPLYIRPADAAPASDPPPVILP